MTAKDIPIELIQHAKQKRIASDIASAYRFLVASLAFLLIIALYCAGLMILFR